MSGRAVPVWKKYTTGSKGIWEFIRKTLTLVPERSSGNPYVPYYRVPAPSSNPQTYKDPRTLPASDIMENDYFARDSRRTYPRISSFDQSQISGLLQLGNVNNPRLLKGDEGVKQLSTIGTEQGLKLSQVLTTVDKSVINGEILGSKGEPIVAPNMNKKFKLQILHENQHGMFDEEYPVRIFGDVKS